MKLENRIHYWLSGILVLLILALAGCLGPKGSSSSTVILSPSRTLIPSTPSSTVLSTAALQVYPSTTPVRKSTRLIDTVEMTANSAYSTQIAPFSGCAFDDQLISPDGNWMFCSPNIGVMNRDGHKLSIDFDNLDHSNLNAAGPIYWSADGNYVYFDTHPSIDGCGISYSYFDGLYRLDLMTGRVSAILPPLGFDDGLYDISFSPTGRRLAYVKNFYAGNHTLIGKIQDLKTGETQSIDLGKDFSEAGGFVWSPDGTRLIIQMQNRKIDNTSTYFSCPVITTTIMVVDVVNNTREIFFGSYPGDLRVQKWSGENVLEYYTLEDNLVRTYDLHLRSYRMVGTATSFP